MRRLGVLYVYNLLKINNSGHGLSPALKLTKALTLRNNL